MKKLYWMIAVLCVLGIASTLWADDGDDPQAYGKPYSGSMNKLVGGVTFHTKIPAITNLPLKDGDFSYDLMYEYHEGIGFWQIGASYAPGPSDNRFDYILTPQVNLIIKDRFYRLGVGALKSHVETQDERHWTDIYWQIIAGIEIPLGSHFGIDLYGHYVFKRWDKITESNDGGLEYSALLAVSF